MEILPDKVEREKDIVWFFDLALWLKAINGGFEVLVAVLVLVIPPSLVVTMTEFITGGEITQDPGDFIANALTNAAHSFAVHTHYFFALYLALHGAIKIFLVIGIFSGKKIAYPLFIVALAFFGAYEAYRGFFKHETLLQVFAVIDLSLLLLTAHEYRRRYPTLPTPAAASGT
jgi:uncharacterized membrane protein